MDQDDLLNSELEEEELTQRNLGATEVQTDDDIENLSTDEDEDEMMVKVAVQVGEDEQLHRSLTADATRHLAETWSKKHNQSCCDSSETTDEESSTEKDEGEFPIPILPSLEQIPNFQVSSGRTSEAQL